MRCLHKCICKQCCCCLAKLLYFNVKHFHKIILVRFLMQYKSTCRNYPITISHEFTNPPIYITSILYNHILIMIGCTDAVYPERLHLYVMCKFGDLRLFGYSLILKLTCPSCPRQERRRCALEIAVLSCREKHNIAQPIREFSFIAGCR